jgi:hypothetical protein
VTFATDCVVTHHLNGSQTTKNTMSVDVVKRFDSDVVVYYVYHCNG